MLAEVEGALELGRLARALRAEKQQCRIGGDDCSMVRAQ